MPVPRRFILASGNPGKLRELRELLAPLDISLVSQEAMGVVQPPEVGQTFIENALAKARHAAAQSGLAAIADDSGLVVDALQGQPGIRSARYAGEDASDADNVAKLLGALSGVGREHRGARFYCVAVALTHVEDPAPIVAQGVWRGRITTAARGAGGVGYDPVFVGEHLNDTAAQLSSLAKNRVSHRGQALTALVAALRAPG